MGYIFVLVLGAVAVVVILAAMVGGRKRSVGKALRGGDVTPGGPAAETPNPAASSTTRTNVAENARRHTPPA